MSSENPEYIIVKRRSSHEDEHHGGAWKIAFADFMTAMMAFFLVLWIINATDKSTKTVIARYFNPVRIEEPARAIKGIRAKQNESQGSGEDAEGAGDPPGGHETKTGEGQQKEAVGAKKDSGGKKSADHGKAESKKEKADPPPSPHSKADAAQRETAAEQRLFSDPYAALDRIAAQAAPLDPPEKIALPPRPTDGPVFQDPFRPPSLSAGQNDVEPTDLPEPRTADQHSPKASAAPETKPERPSQPAAPAPQREEKSANDNRQDPAVEALQRDLKEKLANLGVGVRPNIEIKSSPDGVLISLTDNLEFSMFAVGSAEPQPTVLKAMSATAAVLQKTRGRLVIRGYTDGRRYRSAVYDNWRLSSARAQMAYYMLRRAGVAEERFDRVEGHADKGLRVPKDPLDPRNRRIDILVSEGG
jgi:chemotaxis protein MotB